MTREPMAGHSGAPWAPRSQRRMVPEETRNVCAASSAERARRALIRRMRKRASGE